MCQRGRLKLTGDKISQVAGDVGKWSPCFLIKTTEQLENFLLDHGEQIIDVLGSQVDRIERNIKVCICLKLLLKTLGSKPGELFYSR